MKNLLISFLVFLLSLTAVRVCNAHDEPPKTLKEKQQIENSRLKYRKAGIRKVICNKYLYVKGERQSQKLREFECTYDTNGCVSELSSYRNDTLISKIMNYYDGSFQRVTSIDFKDGRTYTGVDRYEYNESGLILQIMEVSPLSKTLGTIDYIYQPGQLTIQLNKSDSADKLEYTMVFKYEKDLLTGNCLSIVKRSAKGLQMMRVENIYNADGSRKEKRIFKADNKLNYSFKYSYTPSGDFSEVAKMAADGTLIQKEKYEYNEKGFVTSVATFDQQNEIMNMLEYTYYMPAK